MARKKSPAVREQDHARKGAPAVREQDRAHELNKKKAPAEWCSLREQDVLAKKKQAKKKRRESFSLLAALFHGGGGEELSRLEPPLAEALRQPAGAARQANEVCR